MSVGMVIVTHGQAGQALIEVAEFILGESLSEIRHIPFSQSAVHTTDQRELRYALQSCNQGEGILVMTDLIGASPANHVTELLSEFDAVMVSGLNLAMLLRVWNYRDQSLKVLARKAAEGGKRGIEVVTP